MSYNPEEDRLLEQFEQEGRGTQLVLSISALIEDEDLQVRVRVDQELVERYTQEMKAGDQFPPIAAFFDEETQKHRIADGIHRLLANKKLGRTSVSVIIYRGSKRDALRYAIRVNRKHGNALTNEDKNRAVWLMLKAYKGEQIPARQIARLVGVSHTLVNKIAQEFESKELPLSGNGFQIDKILAVDSNDDPNKLQATSFDSSAEAKRIRVVRKGTEYWQKAKSNPKSRTKLEETARQEVSKKDRSSREEWLAKTEERRQEKHAAIIDKAKSEQSLERLGPFTVLLVDPPWQYYVKVSESKAVENHYPMLSTDELCRLDVPSICAEDSILFLWVTAPLSKEGHRLADAWGFDYRTQLIWHKTGAPGLGHWALINHEHLFICVRGKFPTPSHEKLDNSVWSLPRGRHSEKPKEFRAHIEELFPSHLKVELFARERAGGWTSIGNEIDERDIREVLGSKPKEEE